MTHSNPAKRPTMEEAVSAFDAVQQRITKQQKEAKVLYTKDHLIWGIFHKVGLIFKRLF
jgi:hypothetical protein